jgi:uncharacterized repeat protein (TIGR03803 family)
LFHDVSESKAAEHNPLKVFGYISKSSCEPVGSLIEGTNGLLYGVSKLGGAENSGTVFQIARGGSGLQVLKSFSALNSDGRLPGDNVTLLVATNGLLYGTTSQGGVSDVGTIFRIAHDGTGYEILKSFSGEPDDGANPASGLIQAHDGFLYGTTSCGGTCGPGTVFRIDADGGNYSVLKSFGTSPNDAAFPVAPLAEGTNGFLYGTTMLGGSVGKGTVFAIDPKSGFTQVLKSFVGAAGDGAEPRAGLLLAQDGMLYGSTFSGGGEGLGTLFGLRQDGSFYRVFYQFTMSTGANPTGFLIQDSAALLYGTTTGGGSSTNGTIFQVDPDGISHSLLHSYEATCDRGAVPAGALLLASDGALYGLTRDGGMGIYGPASGQGTLFKLEYRAGSPDQHTLLWSFSRAGGDGVDPQFGLVEPADGRLYGVTTAGGAFGQGTVFGLNKNGTGYEIIKQFAGGPDGASPNVRLVVGSDGYLYGTTECEQQRGIPGGFSRTGLGTIFRIHPAGSGYEVLKKFTSSDAVGLIEATNGILYGATAEGRLFRINRDGGGFTLLTPFLSSTPRPLFQGLDGALYGTEVQSGGLAPKLSKIGINGADYQVLKAFSISPSSPDWATWADVTQGRDGLLYGVARSPSRGSIYSLDPLNLSFTTLVQLRGNAFNGLERNPLAHPVQARNRILYGTTGFGIGPHNMGTIYQVCPDGSGYRILTTFNTNGIIYPGYLFEGSEGHLYGMASATQNQLGAIFSFEPPPTLQLLEFKNDNVRLRLLGVPNTDCVLERTSAISDLWQEVRTVRLNADGIAECLYGENGATRAFYRARSE